MEAAHAGKICLYATTDRESGQLAIFLLNRSDQHQLTQLEFAGTGELKVTSIDQLCATGEDPMASDVKRLSGSTESSAGGRLLHVELPPRP